MPTSKHMLHLSFTERDAMHEDESRKDVPCRRCMCAVWLTPELSTAGTLSRCSRLEGLPKPRPCDTRENIPLFARGDCILFQRI